MDKLTASALRVLWAKTARERTAPDSWHPLLAHMWDSAATADWLWDWLPPSVKRLLGGDPARELYRWLAALHDLGKASVAFQTKVPQLAAAVESAGLRCGAPPPDANTAPHGLVSGLALVDALVTRGWRIGEAEWLGLLVGGHHGKFPDSDWLAPMKRPAVRLLGGPEWSRAREELLDLVTRELGVDLDAWRGRSVPIAAQLALTGAVILADWLASNEELFPYVGDKLDDRYRDHLGRRAARAAEVLGLRGAWQPDPKLVTAGDPDMLGRTRFGWPLRPVQRRAVELAAQSDGPGLLLIEAPTGEGKTEAALLAAEVLAARYGQGGIFVGLPTQATANQMFGRVRDWASTSGQVTTIALAHGKAARQEDYRRLVRISSVDPEVRHGVSAGSVVASEWFARKKALLAPVVVGTVDQLLLAGVAGRHVALRHLGLAGKVVVVDEVHAYDAYMSTLLRRVLSWLGAMRAPVILLSATLPSALRRALVSAYAGQEVTESEPGYPRLLWVDAPTGPQADTRTTRDFLAGRRPQAAGPVRPRTAIETASSARTVAVSMVAEPESAGDEVVATLVADLVRDGGCVLVLRNTVGRAQRTYRALRERLVGAEVSLFHARFTVADRRRLETRLVAEFGKEGRRPHEVPRVVVATQVVEQSLDVDFDALVTDLAPIDLLLQRLSRTHRHDRPKEHRPGRLRTPTMYVVGHEPREGEPPRLPGGTEMIYERYLPWRAAAVLAQRREFSVPGDVPELIEAGYGGDPIGPPEWSTRLSEAHNALVAQAARYEAEADVIALQDALRSQLTSLSRLSERDAGEPVDEATPEVQAHVRLGAPTIEVLLLRGTPQGTAAPVSGGPDVPLDRQPSPDRIDLLLDQAIRPPAQVTRLVHEAAMRPEAWQQTPWLARTPVLLLPSDGGPLELGDYRLHYSTELGLEVSRVR